MNNGHPACDLFKNAIKEPPSFLKDHPVLKDPKTIVKKIFPSLGLHNFMEDCKIVKPMGDATRAGGFIYQMILKISQLAQELKTNLASHSDGMQFGSKEEREKFKVERSKISKHLTIVDDFIRIVCFITNPDVINTCVKQEDKKYALLLGRDILNPDETKTNPDGSRKVLFKSNVPLFRIYGELAKEAENFGVKSIPLEHTDEFKTFSVENVPGATLKVVFSSDGEKGAWDIATMSMRGIKSCQRWDGEYPSCLVGSVLSKYIGIIYLTSGADFQGYGMKMMSRCVVRYAIDTHTSKPHILLDRMYPADDKEIQKEFIRILKEKSGLEVLYAPQISANIKNYYRPDEKIIHRLSPKNWPYHDNPLRTKQDIDEQKLLAIKNEKNNDTTAIRAAIEKELVKYLDTLIKNSNKLGNLSNVAKSIQDKYSSRDFIVHFINSVMDYFYKPYISQFLSSNEYKKSYLTAMIKQGGTIKEHTKKITIHERLDVSAKDADVLYKNLMEHLLTFIKKEIIKLG